MKQPKFAFFVGGDFFLDTASKDILVNSTHIAAPLVSGMQVLPEYKSLAGVILAQYFDFGGPDIHETEVRPIYVQTLPNGFWAVSDTYFFIDWEDSEEVGWYQEPRLGKVITKDSGYIQLEYVLSGIQTIFIIFFILFM